MPNIRTSYGRILLTLGSGRALTFGIGQRRLTMAGDAKFFSRPNQIGKGISAHFFHDMGSMKFDRRLRGREFAGDLFIKEAVCDMGHYLALTRRELLIAFTQFPDFRMLLES